jgi:predicted DNA binding CopG/RHH family protein
MKKKFDHFKNLVLDAYEQEIEDSLPDNPDLTPASKREIARFQKVAENTLKLLKKDANMNIRLPQATILKLKSKAAKLGLRYQTLAGSILHQYANS